MTALVLSVTLYCVSFRFARGARNFYRLYRKIPRPCLKGKSGGGQTLPPLCGATGQICASACSRRQSGRRHPQCRQKDAPDRRSSWKHISPQCHVEVTPGRGVPDKISIVCLTGAAHYVLSSNMPQVFDLLLKYGLDPNAVCEGETVLSSVSSVYNEYIAADTMALLMEYGGNPNLVVSGERLFDRFIFLQKAFASDRGEDCKAAFLRPLHRISCVFSHIHI